jgi:hypothetical protein
MAFQTLLSEATHFIEEQTAAYNEHLEEVRGMEGASELWESYLEMQTCEPPPSYYTDLELVLWYINKVNPHPRMVLAIPERRELEQVSRAFVRFFADKERVLNGSPMNASAPA